MTSAELIHKDKLAELERLAEMRRAKQRRFYAANKEKCAATSKAYRLANLESVNAKHAEWVAANQDKVRASRLDWASKNKAKVSEINRKQREKDPLATARRKAEYKKSNVEIVRVSNQNRRARKRFNGGRLSNDISAKLYRLQKGKCACCGTALGDDYHLDHIVPLALGGINADENMQLLTTKCNLQKGAKHPVDFMQSRGRLL